MIISYGHEALKVEEACGPTFSSKLSCIWQVIKLFILRFSSAMNDLPFAIKIYLNKNIGFVIKVGRGTMNREL